jgi:hypothetical protein
VGIGDGGRWRARRMDVEHEIGRLLGDFVFQLDREGEANHEFPS